MDIKAKKHAEADSLRNLKEDIEITREKLNNKILENGKEVNNQETLELSQQLDELIAKYLKNP